jgi:hypothetical protein
MLPPSTGGSLDRSSFRIISAPAGDKPKRLLEQIADDFSGDFVYGRTPQFLRATVEGG